MLARPSSQIPLSDGRYTALPLMRLSFLNKYRRLEAPRKVFFLAAALSTIKWTIVVYEYAQDSIAKYPINLQLSSSSSSFSFVPLTYSNRMERRGIDDSSKRDVPIVNCSTKAVPSR